MSSRVIGTIIDVSSDAATDGQEPLDRADQPFIHMSWLRQNSQWPRPSVVTARAVWEKTSRFSRFVGSRAPGVLADREDLALAVGDRRTQESIRRYEVNA